MHQALIPAPELGQDEGAQASSGASASTGAHSERVSLLRRVFCNRTLDLSTMEAIGFDMVRSSTWPGISLSECDWRAVMQHGCDAASRAPHRRSLQDYTLAQYKPETFEHLAYSQTVEKLTANFGYPDELRRFDFDWQYMMRGLTIDKQRGNVIKVDRHKYVKIAYHGLVQMDKAARQAAYASGTSRQSFDSDDYTTIDTLFSLAEAYLFMQVRAHLCHCSMLHSPKRPSSCSCAAPLSLLNIVAAVKFGNP